MIEKDKKTLPKFDDIKVKGISMANSLQFIFLLEEEEKNDDQTCKDEFIYTQITL